MFGRQVKSEIDSLVGISARIEIVEIRIITAVRQVREPQDSA